jgi:hypothetical protein
MWDGVMYGDVCHLRAKIGTVVDWTRDGGFIVWAQAMATLAHGSEVRVPCFSLWIQSTVRIMVNSWLD